MDMTPTPRVPVAADAQLSCTLTAAQWNIVMAALQEMRMPYRESAPIIAALAEQFQAFAAGDKKDSGE